MRVVGVDIGGSGVRAARVDGGTLGPVHARPLSDRSVQGVVDAVCALVASLGADRVGVGVPGILRGGLVRSAGNFPAWRDVDLGALLSDRLGVPVHVENDGDAAAWGAHLAEGSDDLVVLTLGTGVGGGVVTGGRLLGGPSRPGAEPGHVFAGGDRPCTCGGVGCLETLCSTVGLVASARAAGVHARDARDVLDAAERGVPWAVAAVEDAARGLGHALVTLVDVFAPDTVLLVGGLAAASARLGPTAERLLRERGVGPSVAGVRVVWDGRAEPWAIRGVADLARGCRLVT